MSEKLQASMQLYEQKVLDGEIKDFSVIISNHELVLQAIPASQDGSLAIPLTPELYNSLDIFFSGIDAVPFGSFDYTTLKSLLNAHFVLERMLEKPSEE